MYSRDRQSLHRYVTVMRVEPRVVVWLQVVASELLVTPPAASPGGLWCLTEVHEQNAL